MLRIFKSHGFITGVIGFGYLLVAPINVMFCVARSNSFEEYAISFLLLVIVFILASMFVYELKAGLNRNFVSKIIDMMILSKHYITFVGEVFYILSILR